MDVEPTIARVREFAEARGLKRATLARLAGLNPNTLRHMDRPDWSPNIRTLRRIGAYMKRAETA